MRTRQIGDFAKVQSGFAFKSAEFTREGIRLLRNTNVLPQRVYWDDVAYIEPTQYDHYRAYQLRPGDILLSLDRPIISAGIKVAQVSDSDLPSLLVQRVGRFCLDATQIDADYLYAFLQSPRFVGEISGHDQSLGVPHISPSQVEAVQLLLPDLAEQQQIAARLKAQLAEVETAQAAAKAQANDIAILRRRLLEETFAACATAPRKRLGEHAQTTSGSTPPRGVKAYWTPADVPWVKTGEVTFSPITNTEEAISAKALKECSLTLLPPETVLVAMYGQGKTRGQSAVLKVPATTNQACFAILPNETWDPAFLFHWLMASYHDLRGLSEGRGGSQANLNGGLLNALEIPAPSREQQAAIARRAEDVLREVGVLAAANNAQQGELARLPQRLLAQAFLN